jgi:hypothetical protein
MDTRNPARNAAVPWICLAGTLVLFLFYLARLHPANWFGRYSDDAVYFSSAKALAEGRGYIIPSLPGNPPQTKYPVLYPWLLSAVWKCNPSFPSNLALAVCLTAFFSCWFLVAAFELLRKLKGVGDWPALAIIVFCSFEPHFVLFSGSILSDLPFMALAVTAALVADGAVRADGQLALAGFAGALAGLSMMMRSIGAAVVAGILVAALLRRSLRQMAAFCLVAAPFCAAAFWPARPSLGSRGSGWAAGTALPGWQQTFFYDTSYLKMWRVCVPNFHVFWAMLRTNLVQAVLAPAAYLLSPTLHIDRGWVMNALGAFVGVLSLAGLLRQARGQEWKPIHFIFVFYLAVVLLWNYPIMDRFLLLFLPFFIMGLWIEGMRLSALVFAKLRSAGPAGERVLAGIVAAGLAAMVGAMAWNCVVGYRPQLKSISAERAGITLQTLPVYAWIREHTASEAVIVAAEDTTLYLYTNRQAVVPIAFSTEYVYTGDHGSLERDLGHITDTAVALGACYWLTSQNDFEMLDFPTTEAEDRVAQLTAGLPEVSRSPDGQTRLYDASSLSHQPNAACAANAGGAN